MKILFVYQICSFGGVETVLRNRAVGLRRLGHEPRIVLLEDLGGQAVFAGLEDVEIAPGEARLRDLLEDEALDVVATIDTPSVAPLIARSRFRGRTVAEVHSNNFANMGYLGEVASSGADLLLFPSAYEAELVRREYPAVAAAALPSVVVPNPVDTKLFRFTLPDRPALAPMIGWVGRLEDQKNWRHFLEVAGAVARRRPQTEFVVVGGLAAPEVVKREFRERVASLDLMGRLRWIPSLAYGRMPALYSALAASGGALVPTSSFEPFGMTVLEAQACRCPVVASRTGGLAELVVEGATGLGFEVDDTDGASRQVLRVLDDAGLRAAVINGASDAINARFAAEPVARAYVEAVSAGSGAQEGEDA
ncbi:MAG: glycosyltransferase family 4 protein [Candidatus Binatia bacterium]|nr:glycosyltransferase family 4 protein [Candidatus Binatia bacterium]